MTSETSSPGMALECCHLQHHSSGEQVCFVTAVQDKESSEDKAKEAQQQLEGKQQQLAQQLQQLKADEANLAAQKLQLQV